MHSLQQIVFDPLMGHALSFWFAVFADLLAIGHIPSVIARRQGRPMAALAWILGLIAVPYIGVVLWWFLGRTHLHRPVMRRRRLQFRFRKRSRFQVEGSGSRSGAWSPNSAAADFPFEYHARRLTEGLFPPIRIPEPEVIEDSSGFSDFLDALRGAQFEIRILFYIWTGDATGREVRDILCERARAGVRVFVLLDGMGGRSVSGSFMNPLRRSGAQVSVFLPVRFRPWAPSINFRNHRKLALVDGVVAFTGGMNVADEYRYRWHDFLVRFRGDAVDHLDEIFREDWHFATGRVLSPLTAPRKRVRSGALCAMVASGPDREADRAHDGMFSLISLARKRVWLMTPYFVPGTALLAALRTASLRGVDVRVLTPGRSDVPFLRMASRSYHGALLQAGMRIFEYGPRFLHAKGLLIDDDTAVIGSANVDVRSFRMNFEIVCFLRSRKLAASLARMFVRDFALSHEIGEEEVAARPRWQRQLESAAQLLAPIL